MSLSRKLSIYIALITVVIFCLIGAVFTRSGQRREERLVSLYATLMVENSVSKIDNEFDRVAELLKDNAPVAQRLLDRPEVLKSFVSHLLKEDSLIMGGCVAIRPGYLPQLEAQDFAMEYTFRNSRGEWEKKHLGDTLYDYTRMQWFTDALDATGVVWSDPYFDSGGGNEMMVTCSYPLRGDDGTVVAVLTADISLNELSGEISRLRPIDDSYAFILSDKGVFVAHPDKALVLNKDVFAYSRDTGCRHIAEVGRDMLAGQKGARHIDITGDDSLVIYEPVPGTGWSICSVCSYGSIMAQLGPVTVKAVGLLLVGVLALVILVHFIIVYAMKPLSRLTMAVSKISAGDLDARLPEMKASDEIGRLNNAFAEMQTSLKYQMAQLVESTKAKEHIESELQIARSIQMGLVPHSFSPFTECAGLELFAMLRPAKEVGGDLYDFFIRDSKLFFAIGDVSGKGVPAALFMAVTRTLFRIIAGTTDTPREIMTRLNSTIIEDNDECMFVTMIIGVLDLATGRLELCNAGHNPPAAVSRLRVSMIKVKDNIPVGVMDDFDFEDDIIQLENGEMIFLYTDGLTEAENSRKELFGNELMLGVLKDAAAGTVKECIERMEATAAAFAEGCDQSDDLTMLGIRLFMNTSDNDASRRAESGSIRIVFTNSMNIVSEIPATVNHIGNRFLLDAETMGRLCLMLEEALVNVVSYAYPAGEIGEIEVVATSGIPEEDSEEVTVEIIDGGVPFDPTATAAPDTEASLEERPIGGLGIYLIRSLASRVAYRRENGHNHFSFTLKKTSGPAADNRLNIN